MPSPRHSRSSSRRSSRTRGRTRNAAAGGIRGPAPFSPEALDHFAFDSILHPTAFEESDHLAVIHALKIALAARSKLTFLHVGLQGQDIDWEEFPQIRTVLTKWGIIPEDAEQEDVLATGMTVRKSLRKGEDVVAQIAGEVRSGGTKLMVLSTHQRQGLARLMNKPLVERIFREVRKPSLILPRQHDGFVDPETGQLRLARVLVPVARHPRPERSVEAAIAFTRLLTSDAVTFYLLHVEDGSRPPELEMDFPEKSNWVYEPFTREGKVVDVILDEAAEREVDLVVMGSHGRDGLMDNLRGSTTEQVLRGIECPVLAIPSATV